MRATGSSKEASILVSPEMFILKAMPCGQKADSVMGEVLVLGKEEGIVSSEGGWSTSMNPGVGSIQDQHPQGTRKNMRQLALSARETTPESRTKKV